MVSMKKKPKSINALMAYMRDEKGLSISGSSDKKKLRYMGYFHGYKGYRFHNNPANMTLIWRLRQCFIRR